MEPGGDFLDAYPRIFQKVTERAVHPVVLEGTMRRRIEILVADPVQRPGGTFHIRAEVPDGKSAAGNAALEIAVDPVIGLSPARFLIGILQKISGRIGPEKQLKNGEKNLIEEKLRQFLLPVSDGQIQQIGKHPGKRNRP